MHSTDRQPAVAGMFYPAEPDRLRREVERLLREAEQRDPPHAGDRSDSITAAACPKAIIVPHAGYPYSGPVAATAFRTLQPFADRITRVVLIGPAHRVGFTGMAVPSVDRFVTPLGPVAVDRQMVARIAAAPSVIAFDEAHASEHALEVELPFLQVVLRAFSIVPIVVGDASVEDVAQVLNIAWGDQETVIVVSTDLSHFHSYHKAREIDEVTSNAILALRPEWIGRDQACGRLAVQGLLQTAGAHHLHPELLDLRNSGDTAGPRDRVVGYGAYRFLPSPLPPSRST